MASLVVTDVQAWKLSAASHSFRWRSRKYGEDAGRRVRITAGQESKNRKPRA